MGWGSKVPMQPRSDRWPVLGETVFQVTKRGDCSSFLRWVVFFGSGDMPMGVNLEVLLEGVESGVFIDSELLPVLVPDDEDAGVEERLLPVRRARTGFVRFGPAAGSMGLALNGGRIGPSPTASISRVVSAANSSSSMPLG